MPIDTMCSAGVSQTLQSMVYPLAALSALVTGITIGVTYMVGNALSNPKLTLWAKTEAIQLIISLFTVLIVLQSIGVFCTIDMASVYSLFSVTTTGMPAHLSVFMAAENYLVEGGNWTHTLMNAARYHIGGFYLMQMFGRNTCEDFPAALQWLFCAFGSSISNNGISGAGSISFGPDSGYGLLISVLSASFNSIVFSFMSILNYLFILRFAYSGFVLLFLPMGIFLRALPYIRTLGSLLMSVAVSFLIIYPFILAAFYMDFHADKVLIPDSTALVYAHEDIGSKVNLGNVFSNSIYGSIFDSGGDRSLDIIMLTGNAFLVGVFIPSLALLAAVASVGYINRFLGEEIDLSRIVQLM